MDEIAIKREERKKKKKNEEDSIDEPLLFVFILVTL